MSEKLKSFFKKHPIFSYLALSTIVGKVCRMIVDMTRAFTGKYPPSEVTIHIPELNNIDAGVKTEPEKTTETPIEEEPFQKVYDSIKADEENSEVTEA